MEKCANIKCECENCFWYSESSPCVDITITDNGRCSNFTTKLTKDDRDVIRQAATEILEALNNL